MAPGRSDEAAALELQIETLLASRNTRALSLDLHGLSEIDTFGACLLERLTLKWREAGPVEVSGLPPRFRGLMAEVERVETIPDVPVRRRPEFPVLEPIGRAIFAAFSYIATFMNMLGAVVAALLRVIAHPRRMRFTSLVAQLDRVGLRAIPIILLITILIGGIIQQQSIFQLRKFGAESYAVNLTGILVLREIGVLLVAIMVAGRSGSAYTAELGSMKMREEIDALRTMGLDPAEVLILPRLLALVIALPILGLIGGIAALFGAGLVGWIYAGKALRFSWRGCMMRFRSRISRSACTRRRSWPSLSGSSRRSRDSPSRAAPNCSARRRRPLSSNRFSSSSCLMDFLRCSSPGWVCKT